MIVDFFVLAIALGTAWFVSKAPAGLENYLAILVGVFAGLRLEHWVGVRRDRAEGKKARRLLWNELEANRAVAEDIARQEKDYPAVVASVIALKVGLWSALSSGGRVSLVGNLDLIRALDKAYGTLHDLRQIADLFFQGSKWVTSTHGAGLNTTFDALRKSRAVEAVGAITDAKRHLERQGMTDEPADMK